MILPTKHLPLDKSAIGSAAILLRNHSRPMTVSELWENVAERGIRTFDQFILGLTLLYTLGAVTYRDGRLVRDD
jgi:hypothetical protein